MRWNVQRNVAPVAGLAVAMALSFVASAGRARLYGAENGTAGQATFAKDVAPILQAKCQSCHRPGGGAPMSLITYEEARPWARSIKLRTGLGTKPDVMPPWFIDKTIGIQSFKSDMSLSDVEIAKIATWVDSGAPMGNPADMPPPRKFTAANEWQLGTPDLIVPSPSFEMPALAPDRFTPIGTSPTGLTEDRYVSSVEVREITDSIESAGETRQTVGGQVIFHHLAWLPMDPNGKVERSGDASGGGSWPVHEVGRNPEIFYPEAGKLLAAGSTLNFISAHVHSNGRRTKAHVEVGFKFHPKGYLPTKSFTRINAVTGDLDIRPMEANQKVEGFVVLRENVKIISFEPHMHAYGARMCLDAIYSATIETLSCAGYNHSWVRTYTFAEGSEPLLPKGTILRKVAYYDNTPANKNVPDPRNWAGQGHRSIDNMSVAIALSLSLTDEEFKAEVAKRAAQLPEGQTAIGCPLCGSQRHKAPQVAAAGR